MLANSDNRITKYNIYFDVSVFTQFCFVLIFDPIIRGIITL